MGITISGQTGLLLSSFLLGVVLGAVFDIFRVIRISARSGRVAVFVQDVIFWLICAASTFVFFLLMNKGKLRFLMLLTEFLGAALYYNSIGIIVTRKVKQYDASIKRHTKAAVRLAAKPVMKYGGKAAAQISKSERKTGSFLKKQSKVLNLRLKVHRTMMYNLIRSAKKPKNIEK